MSSPLDEVDEESRPSRAQEEPTLGIAIVRLDREFLGLPVVDVQEVITIDVLTPLFHLPPHVLGVMNLRGHVLPVAQLGPVLGLPPATGNRAVVVRPRSISDAEAAFLVDEVAEIRWVRPSALMDVPPTVQEERRRFFRALIPGTTAAMLLATEELVDPKFWSRSRDGSETIHPPTKDDSR